MKKRNTELKKSAKLSERLLKVPILGTPFIRSTPKLEQKGEE